jgi:HEAT repeat protein
MTADPVEGALAVLAAPRGGGPGALVARDAALAVLLAAPDSAHLRLLELAGGAHPPPLVLLALAAFGRADSVPVLAAALRGGDAPTVVIAAEALARHPAPAARTALEEALAATDPQVVVAAALGLGLRGEPAAVPALRAALAAWPAGEVRGRIAAALAGLDPNEP